MVQSVLLLSPYHNWRLFVCRNGPTGGLHSGLSGHQIPMARDPAEERRLIRWLNDEWKTNWHSGKDGCIVPDIEDTEDVLARQRIVQKFIPRLTKAQRIPASAGEALSMGRHAMDMEPGRYRDLEHATAESCGVNDRARVVRMLAKYKLVPVVPHASQTLAFIATGDNATGGLGCLRHSPNGV